MLTAGTSKVYPRLPRSPARRGSRSTTPRTGPDFFGGPLVMQSYDLAGCRGWSSPIVQVPHQPGRQQVMNKDIASRRQELAGKRSEEHTSELQSLMRISYAVFCLKKKKTQTTKRG